MTLKKAKRRRQRVKLTSAIRDGLPWSIMPSAYERLLVAAEDGSVAGIEAALEFGRQDEEPTTSMINGTAVISVNGVLQEENSYLVKAGYAASYQVIERDIKKAIADPQVQGVMLLLNTPGGSAIGVKRVADTIFAARGSKPIVAYCQGMCGSAGFYLMAAADRSYATADSLIGSIGTIYHHQDASKMMADYGVNVTVVTNDKSPKKGHGNAYEPLQGEAKKTLQGFINSYGDGFISDVAKYRNISPEQVVSSYGQGDAFRADVALGRGMIDGIVSNFEDALGKVRASSGPASISATIETASVAEPTPVFQEEKKMTITAKIRAMLFALGYVQAADASDQTCEAALTVFLKAKGIETPANEQGILDALTGSSSLGATAVLVTPTAAPLAAAPAPAANTTGTPAAPAPNVATAHATEMAEARLSDLLAAAAIVNATAGEDRVTTAMINASAAAGHNSTQAVEAWNGVSAAAEPAIPAPRANVIREGRDEFALDAIDALCFRSSDNAAMEMRPGARNLLNRPLHAIAAECLLQDGQQVDIHGPREEIAEMAMQMGNPLQRHRFYSEREDARYLSASIPASRPGDFPNILSGMANKFLDSIELDEDYSYPLVSATLPGGLKDFKPSLMINKGVVDELDELKDAEQLKELGLEEEVLSYIYLRRFGNAFGWTPVMVANDDMNAFAEGMIGLAEAWQLTQNRLVLERFTSTETLLDGSALFANRADTGSGANPALNNNARTGGGVPSDAEWAAMETLYNDIGGINTGRRVRGTINTCFCPTGTVAQSARRTFMPLNAGGLEDKVAATTANVGLYRNQVGVIPESELRVASLTTWYGLRNPTRLNTATVVRGYFNGFGTAGRRERWYDPSTKTTYVSLEGRAAAAVKNWRYAVRNVT
jgi:signal peptide peptidase SppA